jgi:hypothetical protein
MITDDKGKTVELSGSASISFSMAPATLRAYTKLPENHPFYALVGRIASEWSFLEMSLDTLIWTLADIEDAAIGACITSSLMGVGPRCKVILSLCKRLGISEKTQKDFRTLMNDSYPIADLRARWVHDPWYADAATPDDATKAAQYRNMPYSDPVFGIKDRSIDDFNHTMDRITKLRIRTAELKNIALDELVTLQKRN